jgi:hypothetical protein
VRTRVLCAMVATSLVLGGCGASTASGPKGVKTSTTLSTSRDLAKARHFLRTIVDDDRKAMARDSNALANSPIESKQISRAYCQFAVDTLKFKLEIVRYSWPKSAVTDARNVVTALSALVADWRLAARLLPDPNFLQDNNAKVADLQHLSADLANA